MNKDLLRAYRMFHESVVRLDVASKRPSENYVYSKRVV